jgi:hypothetical protein
MLVIGNTFSNVLCESFLDLETNRVRVRSLGDSNIPAGVLVECLKSIREQYPIGTRFYAEEMKVCKKTDGRIYLRAKDQLIYKY